MAGDSVKMHVLMDHYNQLQLTLEEYHTVTPSGVLLILIDKARATSSRQQGDMICYKSIR